MTASTRADAIRLLDGAFYAGDPHEHFRWMREHAPLFWDPAGEVWGVTRYADVLAIARNPRTFCSGRSSRPDAPPLPSMINLDEPQHTQRRTIVNRGFTPRRVAEQEAKIRAICVDLIERVRPHGACDFVRDIAAPLPMAVVGDMLGVEPEDRDMVLGWSDDLLAGLSSTAAPEAQAAMAGAFEAYADYHARVVADRRAHPRHDLVSLLVHTEIEGIRLSDDAILQESLLILVGGDETTRHVISGGVEQLIRHPDQRQTLVERPALIPSAVEEMLRWVTPIQNMNRTAVREVELHDRVIRAGDRVLLLYPSANRDPRAFPEPERFDVTRTPNEHLTFGFGAHYCLGASLARLEVRVMLEELLARLPGLALASDASLPRRPSNFIVGIASMPVSWTP